MKQRPILHIKLIINNGRDPLGTGRLTSHFKVMSFYNEGRKMFRGKMLVRLNLNVLINKTGNIKERYSQVLVNWEMSNWKIGWT